MSLEIARGEVLALVGENGAGKTSLMNVLYGLYEADAGEVAIRGETVRIRGPGDAIRRGIGMVHQHFMLVPTLTVAENVVMGREPRRFGVLLDFEKACEQVQATCERFGFKLDPRARVEDLSVGSQQKVEIVKALHRGAEVLILDEPTAVLTPQEADELFVVVRQLAAQGHSVVLISHKLSEVLSVAERIVVLRRGKKVAEVRAAETNAQALAELMVGGAAASHARMGGEPAPRQARGEPPSERKLLLTVEELNSPPALRGVNLTVEGGEIVGIAGIDGNGQRELAEVLTGLRRGTGSIQLLGREILNASPGELRAHGIGHVPEDRLLRAIVGAMSVEENLALGRHAAPPFARGMRIDFEGRRARAEALMEQYDVRPRDRSLAIARLSGGNQQKVVLARELDSDPKLLVVVQPTRGLDIAAVKSIHARLRERRAAGAGILLVSLDLDEVLELSDRLYVFVDGRIAGQLPRPEFDARRIGRMMLGTADEPPSSEVAHG